MDMEQVQNQFVRVLGSQGIVCAWDTSGKIWRLHADNIIASGHWRGAYMLSGSKEQDGIDTIIRACKTDDGWEVETEMEWVD